MPSNRLTLRPLPRPVMPRSISASSTPAWAAMPQAMSQADTPTRPGPAGMAGDHRQARLRLHQQVVGLHRGVLAGVAIAGDVDGDQARMARAQIVGAEARRARPRRGRGSG